MPRIGLRNTDPALVPARVGAVQKGAAGDPILAVEALAPYPSRKGGAQLRGGLRHTLAQPRPPAASRRRVKLTCAAAAAAALRAPSSALRKLWSGPLPQPGPGGGAGARSQPIRNGLP